MASNVCERCHRGLKDPQSIKFGMGPVCRSKAGRGGNDMGDNDKGTIAELPFDGASMDIVCCRVPTGEMGMGGQPMLKAVFNISQTVVHHSPTGFEFGYGGSGPADFALNILNLFVPPGSDGCLPMKCFLGECSRTAWALHQEFKVRFVAALSREGGTIHGSEIRAFIAEHRAEIEERARADEMLSWE